MTDDIGRNDSRKGAAGPSATETFDVSVDSKMSGEVTLLCECFVALVTGEWSLLAVHSLMSVKVGLIHKSLATVDHWTFKLGGTVLRLLVRKHLVAILVRLEATILDGAGKVARLVDVVVVL